MLVNIFLNIFYKKHQSETFFTSFLQVTPIKNVFQHIRPTTLTRKAHTTNIDTKFIFCQKFKIRICIDLYFSCKNCTYRHDNLRTPDHRAGVYHPRETWFPNHLNFPVTSGILLIGRWRTGSSFPN